MTSQTDPPEEPDAAQSAAQRPEVQPDDVQPAVEEPEAEPDGLEPDVATSEKSLEKGDDSLPPARDAPILDRAGDHLSTWLRSRKLWIAAAAILVVLIAATVVWPMFDPREDEAEAVVREYLEAIQAKDLAKAKKIAPLGHGEDALLMQDEALDTDWSVHSLRSDDFDTGDWSGEVTALLKASNGEVARYDYQLRRADYELENPLVIEEGYVRVHVVDERNQGVTINGVALESDDEYMDNSVDVLLYPGVYRFGHAMEDFVDADWQQRVWAGGSYSVDVTGKDVDQADLGQPEPWSLNETGETAAQELMKSHIDSCSEETEGLIANCPFGIERVTLREEDAVIYSRDLEDIKWEVEEYPEVAVAQYEGVYRFADRRRGTANFTATRQEGRGEVEVECEIRTTNLVLDIGDDGQLEVGSFRNYELDMWDTCRGAEAN